MCHHFLLVWCKLKAVRLSGCTCAAACATLRSVDPTSNSSSTLSFLSSAPTASSHSCRAGLDRGRLGTRPPLDLAVEAGARCGGRGTVHRWVSPSLNICMARTLSLLFWLKIFEACAHEASDVRTRLHACARMRMHAHTQSSGCNLLHR